MSRYYGRDRLFDERALHGPIIGASPEAMAQFNERQRLLGTTEYNDVRHWIVPEFAAGGGLWDDSMTNFDAPNNTDEDNDHGE